MTFVLDASITAAWIFPDEVSDYAEGIMRRLQDSGAIVPPIWPLEMTNILLVGERRQRITEAQSARMMRILRSLPITVEPGDMLHRSAVALGVARTYRLSVYDATYLELAMREGAPLATLDGRLREAAAAVGVSLQMLM